VWLTAAAVFVVSLAAACGGEGEQRSILASRDCFATWNAEGNEGNRRDLRERGFPLGGVARYEVDDQAQSSRVEVCAYLFHDDFLFKSYSGSWDGDAIVWDNRAVAHGGWTPRTQQRHTDDARVLGDGGIVRRAQARPPSAAPPAVDSLEHEPPPAWVETARGVYWLGYSTFCWPRAGCADAIAPSCDDERHVPRIPVRKGELVRFHLGFAPSDVLVSMLKGDEALDRLLSAENPVWRARRGAFALMAVAMDRGDASYAGCAVVR
jgi:hypothetical protein